MRKTTVVVTLLVCAGWLVGGCAQEKVRESATWLAAANNTVKEEAASYKEHRDALAKARRMSINVLESDAMRLEGDRATMMMPWGMPTQKSPQLAVFETVIAESVAAEKRLLAWEQLRREQEEKVAAARSSVASISAQLANTSKALAALGEEPDVRSQAEFYTGFFMEVNTHLKELEKDAKKEAESGVAKATSKSEVPERKKDKQGS